MCPGTHGGTIQTPVPGFSARRASLNVYSVVLLSWTSILRVASRSEISFALSSFAARCVSGSMSSSSTWSNFNLSIQLDEDSFE